MILVTGGAGYVGSHMVKMLRETGRSVVVLDDLSTGFENALLGAQWLRGSIGDRQLLNQIFSKYQITSVMNFASFIAVGESIESPSRYYLNNVANTLTLLDAMVLNGVKQFIFSSTAAIFGDTNAKSIDESSPRVPTSPYGQSKYIVEQILDDFDAAYGLKSVCLRYFNAAGADPGGELGERHCPETHLIPLVLQAASGRRSSISILGDDYDTLDGSCVRDFVHVQDLCVAHLLALNHLLSGGDSRQYNLGTSTGFSVKEVIDVARNVTGRKIPVKIEPRRIGDPARLVADSRRISRELGWKPQRAELGVILNDAWKWELKWPWKF